MAKNHVYLTFQEAVKFHVLYMRAVGETRFGVFDGNLIESALARPKHASNYENADIVRQSASLCVGLIKNDLWEGRTATLLTILFLKRNGWKLTAKVDEIGEMVLAVESGERAVDAIEKWLRLHSSRA